MQRLVWAFHENSCTSYTARELALLSNFATIFVFCARDGVFSVPYCSVHVLWRALVCLVYVC